MHQSSSLDAFEIILSIRSQDDKLADSDEHNVKEELDESSLGL